MEQNHSREGTESESANVSASLGDAVGTMEQANSVSQGHVTMESADQHSKKTVNSKLLEPLVRVSVHLVI
jgi:hypothetical protein